MHANLVRPYLLHDRAEPGALAAAYGAAARWGTEIGMGSVWRMYSPVPRELRETRWYAMDRSGRWVALEGPGSTAAHRRGRSLVAALLWDFKRARVNDNYFITRYVDLLPRLYVAATRAAIAREVGEMPVALRVQSVSAAIPTPSEKGDWTPERARFDRVAWETVFR